MSENTTGYLLVVTNGAVDTKVAIASSSPENCQAIADTILAEWVRPEAQMSGHEVLAYYKASQPLTAEEVMGTAPYAAWNADAPMNEPKFMGLDPVRLLGPRHRRA